MTKRYPVRPAPGPLEGYAQDFDELFRARAQRHSFRRYVEGLLLPAERNKTLTALANTEPVVGAQRKEAQSLQWFLSESGWDPKEVNRRRVKLMLKDPKSSAPSADGVLVIDEHGDRKWGKHTAHVGRQWLANIGKTESGVVSVSGLLADESVYSRVFICGKLWSSTAVAGRRTIRTGRAEGHELAPDLDGGIGVGVDHHAKRAVEAVALLRGEVVQLLEREGFVAREPPEDQVSSS